jgi:predicted DNA-binding transcriptional regulator AlpA
MLERRLRTLAASATDEQDDPMQSKTIPEVGFLRLPQVLAVIPVSRSTWWAGVKSGRYPRPTRALGRRITAWRAEDIRSLIEQLEHADSQPAGEGT